MTKGIKTFELNSNGVTVELLENGNIRDIRKDDLRIKQLLSNNLESSPNNIFMKVIDGEDTFVSELMGPKSPSKFFLGSTSAKYVGEFSSVKYEVKLNVVNDTVFFTVNLEESKNKEVYIYYGLDISIANKYAVRNNEAYVCQYIDHKAYFGTHGYTVCSRQNQGTHTYLEQGSLEYVASYSTDGFDFFKENYKFNNKANALYDETLSNRVYQYEFAYTALQSKKIILSKPEQITFYCSYLAEIPGQITEPLLKSKVLSDFSKISNDDYVEKGLNLKVSFDNTYSSKDFSNEEIDELYKEKYFKELSSNKLLSFFLENKSYVTLKAKEELLERPTGNIIISGNYLDFEQTLANTSYMFGVFNSQIVLGNTSFNKLSSNLRNPLNIQKISGMRIFVKLDSEYKLLTMPSSFEAGLNYSKWIYKINDDYLEVLTYTSKKESKLITKISSKNNIEYSFIITNEITLGPNEHEYSIDYKREKNKVIFTPLKTGMQKEKYTKAYFGIELDQDFLLSDDSIFYEDGVSRGENLVNFMLTSSSLNIVTIADNFGTIMNYKYRDFTTESADYLEQISSLICNIDVDYTFDDKYKNELNSYNFLLYWYANNSLIHYTSPHGLEQYNGAAWGTRDLCQGPAEFFLSTGNFKEVRRIIINLFKHQYNTNGNWPQWFMFDKFYQIQQRESHGDIIVWPARLVGLYISKTNDYSILKEKVSYTDYETLDFTKEKHTILSHLKNEISNIEKSFIKGTFLSCYGGGDWDDTLQPANHELTKSMVSGWTVSLTYDMLNYLSSAVKPIDKEYSNELSILKNNVKADYNKYMIIDGISAGFIIFDESGNFKPVIHPKDKETKLKYRLLPFNRGIISGLFNEKDKDDSLRIIKDNLTFPDGVRLMDNTVTYKGGENTYFQRAETGANFGREIGLQYVHAHIRYCEALAKVGLANEFIHGLSVINPVIIRDEVKNAMTRQRNSYFSSSDGNFINRYDAMKNYNQLKTGETKVKAGWRIYSSGPGIYTYQVFNNLFGIKYEGDSILFDPTLPSDMKDFSINLTLKGKEHRINYINSGSKEVETNNKLYLSVSEETYRTGGVKVKFKDLGKAIDVHF